MPSEYNKARSIMIEAVKNRILPELHSRGFAEIETPKESVPMWHLNRRRDDGRYDAISIVFDEKRRPYFDATINSIDSSGINYPWGESIAAQRVTADTPLKRILLQKKRRGILSMLLARWFSHEWFGFKPREDAEFNKQAASAACEEFIVCLNQADHWWRSRELGPNLIEAEMGAILRDPNAPGGAHEST